MHLRWLFGGMLLPLILMFTLFAASVAAHPRNYRAHLSGSDEVPPVATRAQGQAIFKLSKDGTELSYKLIIANIDDVTQAHIHCGAEGVNGPVVAFLFGFVDGGVTTNGVLVTGVITPDNVIARPDSEACPGGISDFDDLLDLIVSGNAYVNVHTVAYPAGEIRGQIR